MARPGWDVPGPEELPALRAPDGSEPTPGEWEIRLVNPGGFWSDERKQVWSRDNRPLVAGEPLTPLVRAALSADLPNPLANAGAEGLSFINADLTLFLARPPGSDWIGLEVADHVAADGLAIGTCTLYDLAGPSAGRACAPSPTRCGHSDIYRSPSHDGGFGPAVLIEELSTAAQDGHPNLRRDGLEIFFFSNRPGSLGNDIYVATRAKTTDPWSTPVNLGPAVNSEASETRPSLSWDGRTLYFGSNRPGGEGDADHYVTNRRAHAGCDRRP